MIRDVFFVIRDPRNGKPLHAGATKNVQQCFGNLLQRPPRQLVAIFAAMEADGVLPVVETTRV